MAWDMIWNDSPGHGLEGKERTNHRGITMGHLLLGISHVFPFYQQISPWKTASPKSISSPKSDLVVHFAPFFGPSRRAHCSARALRARAFTSSRLWGVASCSPSSAQSFSASTQDLRTEQCMAWEISGPCNGHKWLGWLKWKEAKKTQNLAVNQLMLEHGHQILNGLIR